MPARRHCAPRRASLLAVACLVAGCSPVPDGTPAPQAASGTSAGPAAMPAPAPEPAPVARDDDPPALKALLHGLPADAADFVRRAVVCNHWAGEEPFDEDRRTQIRTAVDSLRCRALDADQKALQRQYAGNDGVLKRLGQARRTPL